MVFPSVIFLCCFLPLFLVTYYVSGKKFSLAVLLLYSLVFYMWNNPPSVIVLIMSVGINYFGAVIINGVRKSNIKKISLILVVVLNLLLLFVYKYLNFATEIVNGMFDSAKLEVGTIALPLGISFFTFQGMSYVIDVYNGKVNANKNILKVTTYIVMFPQLVAGPIVRYKSIEEQLTKPKLSLDNLFKGSQRFIIGLSKKVLIADVLAGPADLIFSGGGGLSIWNAWLGIICYTLQIYYDFSGYSDMAIGLGRMIGVVFPENFNKPYLATSVSDFWRRWHITLGEWFRDYLYIPLGGSRKGNIYINLLIVFFLTGIWHGANWTFLVWGLWHGLFIVIERWIRRNKQWEIGEFKLVTLVRWGMTFVIVIVGWVFFRCNNLHDAFSYIATMFGKQNTGFIQYTIRYYLTNKIITTLIIAALFISPLPELLKKYVNQKKVYIVNLVKDGLIFLMLCMCMMSIINGNYSPFIYFQF